MATTSKTGTGANFTDDGRPIDHSLVSLSEYQNARGQPQTDYEGLVYDAAGGSRIMTPTGERYYSPYAAQPTKEELSWLMSQPNLTNVTNPTERAQKLESWQESRPGYVDPMDYKTYEDYAAAANIKLGKDAGNDLTGRSNFYGMTIENYQNALSGDPTKPMGGNQAVYGSQLLSPLEQRAAEVARGQGISTMSPETLALAKANPDVFNAASQRFQNYLATTYPGTLEYESVLSGPMQFSGAGVKYPEIKDTVSMYILDRRTGQIIRNPNYKPPVRKAEGGLMSVADHMASKGRGPDSMLIHMSPREVQGLQALAENHGGSLTINPETGLPEAGFLDKLLPTILGAGLSLIPGVGPLMAAGIVGGIQTVRTGDIGKGLAAGLGAYGGAGLAQGLATAGAETLNTAAGQSYLSNYAPPGVLEGAGAGLSADMAYNLADAGITTAGTEGMNAAQLAAVEKAANATPFDRLSVGASQAVSSPKAAGAFLKDNAKNLMYAAGPAILAGANVQAKGPQTITKPGMIRPYSFDPYGGTYTAGTPYEATPIKPAAHGGLMGLANGGMAGYEDDEEGMATGGMGGMFNFAQQSEPVVRMAGGGVVALAGGGDYRSLTKDSSADDIASAYKQFTTAGGGDTAANQQAAISYLTNLGIGQDKIGQAYGTYQASPTYTNYTPEQMGSFLANPVNKDINLDKAIIDTNANPADVNRYIASLASPFVGSTDTTGGSGTLGIYNNMVNKSISPDEYYAAALANDPKYGGWDKGMITKGYDLSKGAYALTAQIEKDKIAADPVLGYDKQWVKFMEDNKYSVDDMAQAFGISKNEIRDRIQKVKDAEKKVTTPITCGPGFQLNAAGTACEPITVVKPPITNTTPIIYNTAGTNAPGGLEGVLGLPPGVSGAGITTVNPNGTITTRPNIPGIPEGGFTGMTDVRDAYEKGGGSLGYVPYTPKTIEEFDTKYGSKLTGGSKQSYDYLTGKTKYSPTPYTPTGEVMKPYAESVLGVPMASSKKMYLFDPTTKQYKINPDYAIPTYDKDGKKSLNLTNQDVINYVKSPEYSNDDAFVSWMTANNLSPEQVAAATGMSIADVYKKIKKAKPVEKIADTPITGQNDGGGGGDGGANGGLMKLAGGGMSGQFNLGDYSDGGRLLRGPGDGVSDSIPASIGGKRPARLADGEFVVPARIVSELGNGSTEAGARKLYAMMDRIQKARRGTVGKGRVAKNSRSDKYLPA